MIMSTQFSAYAGWTRTLVARPRMPLVTTFFTRSSPGMRITFMSGDPDKAIAHQVGSPSRLVAIDLPSRI